MHGNQSIMLQIITDKRINPHQTQLNENESRDIEYVIPQCMKTETFISQGRVTP